jgi:exodeoxyribonuclease VII large subunit
MSHRVERLAATRVRAEANRLAAIEGSVVLHARGRLAANRATLALAEARIASLDPVRLLSRGWSLTTSADGTIVRSVRDVDVGDTITIRISDGSLRSTVDAALQQEGSHGSEA